MLQGGDGGDQSKAKTREGGLVHSVHMQQVSSVSIGSAAEIKEKLSIAANLTGEERAKLYLFDCLCGARKACRTKVSNGKGHACKKMLSRSHFSPLPLSIWATSNDWLCATVDSRRFLVPYRSLAALLIMWLRNSESQIRRLNRPEDPSRKSYRAQATQENCKFSSEFVHRTAPLHAHFRKIIHRFSVSLEEKRRRGNNDARDACLRQERARVLSAGWARLG